MQEQPPSPTVLEALARIRNEMERAEADARKQAAEILKAARDEAARIRDEAQREATEIVAHAEERACDAGHS